MTTSDPSDHKAELRRRLLAARGQLDGAQRQRLDRRVCSQVLQFVGERDDLTVAAFVAFKGEPDLMPVLTALHGSGRRVYLPVLDSQALRFRRWRPQQPLVANQFGILEPPAECAEIAPHQLDLVLMPLVAYSPTGVRLGMGAGYYDRTFAFCCDEPEAGPLLVGVAYGLQQVDSLPAERWDVPLHAVITDLGVLAFGSSAASRLS